MHKAIINMNGNDGKHLVTELRLAHEALGQAHEALCKITVHGRNYQTNENPEADLNSDIIARSKMLNAITDIQQEVMQAAIHIMDQLK